VRRAFTAGGRRVPAAAVQEAHIFLDALLRAVETQAQAQAQALAAENKEPKKGSRYRTVRAGLVVRLLRNRYIEDLATITAFWSNNARAENIGTIKADTTTTHIKSRADEVARIFVERFLAPKVSEESQAGQRSPTRLSEVLHIPAASLPADEVGVCVPAEGDATAAAAAGGGGDTGAGIGSGGGAGGSSLADAARILAGQDAENHWAVLSIKLADYVEDIFLHIAASAGGGPAEKAAGTSTGTGTGTAGLDESYPTAVDLLLEWLLLLP
jgi:hypothetical protein